VGLGIFLLGESATIFTAAGALLVAAGLATTASAKAD